MWNSREQRAFQVIAPMFGLILSVIPINAQTITWSEHIAPIIYSNCVDCHRDGGAAPFSLLDYDDAKENAQKIARVVEDRVMPPWMLDPVHSASIKDDRRLTEEEVSKIVEWAENGTRRGSPRRAPKPPKFSDSWQLGEPDLVLQMSDPISVPAEGADLYRNFVIPVELSESKYVRAVEFLPESQTVLRQAVMLFDESDWARRSDASDALPGFDGLDLSSARNSTGQYVSWSPGADPYHFDQSTPWQIGPNGDLVLQLHIRSTGDVVITNPRIGLFFAAGPSTKATDSLFLHTSDNEQLAGDIPSVFEERLTLPVAVSVSGLIPHARSLISSLEVFAELANGQKQPLLRIPDWDSNWQSDYQLEDPVLIPAGAELVMRSTLSETAGDMFSNHRSEDAMAQSIVQLELRDFADKAAIEKAQIDYEVERAGGLANYYFNVGEKLEAIGRTDEAIAAFEQAAQEDAAHGEARNRLGLIYEQQDNKTQAEYYYREAIDADGSLQIARLNLGRFLRKSKRQQAAAKVLQEAVDQEPEYLLARLELSALFIEQKLFKLAIKLLEDGLKIDPLEPYLNLQTGKVYVMDQRPEDSIKYFEAAAQGKQENVKYGVTLESVKVQANWIPARMFEAGGNTEKMNYYLDRVFEIDPAYLEARLLLVNKLLESRQDIEARKHLEFLLKLPIEEQPPPPALIAELSFPQGVRLLADVYKRTQRSEIGKGILTQALEVAEKQRNRIWITQLQNDLARYR